MHKVLELPAVNSTCATVLVPLRAHDRQTLRVILQLHSRATWSVFRVQVESPQKRIIQGPGTPCGSIKRALLVLLRRHGRRFIILNTNETLPEDSSISNLVHQPFLVGLQHVLGRRQNHVTRNHLQARSEMDTELCAWSYLLDRSATDADSTD